MLITKTVSHGEYRAPNTVILTLLRHNVTQVLDATKGDLMGARGGTNAMKIASIPEVLEAAPNDWKSHCPAYK